MLWGGLLDLVRPFFILIVYVFLFEGTIGIQIN